MYKCLVFRRAILELPVPAAQPITKLRQLQRAECLLAGMRSPHLLEQLWCAENSERIQRLNLGPAWHPLWHELSERAMSRSASTRFHAGRTVTEQKVAARIAPRLASALACSNAAQFVAEVESIGRCFSEEQHGFRDHAVFLRTDAHGGKVQFPAARHIKPQLQKLHKHIRAHLCEHPLFVALIAMVAVLNCHPFRDGNGRCGRVMFNVLLQISRCQSEGYVPLYELFWRSGCGWEIRVRYAEITGEWAPLCEFIYDLVHLSHALTRLPDEMMACE
jgi:hypothetical protein